MNMKSVFIVWYSYSQRAKTLAAELDGQISFQYEAGLKGLWLTPLRYLIQGWKTWRFLEWERPEIVLVQTPPIFAAMTVALWCRLRGKTRNSERRAQYVIDAHTATFHHHDWRWALPLVRFLSQRALVTLVTDEVALGMLHDWNAKGLFLTDGTYSALLKNVHGLVVLTKQPNDLSCAAYEGLAIAKPIVSSNGPEMRRFFTRGIIFVNNTPESISDGIKQMLDEQATLTKEVITMRSVLEAKRQPKLEEFISLIQ